LSHTLTCAHPQAAFDSQAPTEADADESADPLATTEVLKEDSEEEEAEEESESDVEEEDADSSFDGSAASVASPSPTPTPEPSPSKRSPKKSAARSSPVKRSSPVNSVTPARKMQRATSDEDDDEVENDGERAQTKASGSNGPLRESVGQQDTSFTSWVPSLKLRARCPFLT
jgi:hypothetical protein